jgi:hypothetical protein
VPSASCHLRARHALRGPDTAVSAAWLDRAMTAIRRRKAVDHAHDVPYLAGYATDGKTIYVDRHLPRSYLARGGRRVRIERFLLLHEAIEKALIDEVGLHYQHAHQIATRAEQAAVRAEGLSWAEYDRFTQRYVKSLGSERVTRPPPDLDLRPYVDEHDSDVLKRLRARMRQGRA